MSNRAILLAVLVMVVWGVHNVVLKFAVTQAPPLLMLALRLGLTGLILLPFVRLKREQLGGILRYGLWMNAGHLPAVFLMYSFLTASSGSVLFQIYVPMAALWGAWVYGETFGWRTGLGIGVSFLGMLVLFGAPDVNFWGVVFTFAAVFSAILRDDNSKRMRDVDLVPLLSLSCLAAFPFVLGLSFMFEFANWPLILHAPPENLVLIFGYQVFLLSASHMMWQRLVSSQPLAQISMMTMLAPMVSVTVATLALGEKLTPELALGGGLILLGVGIVMVRRAQKAA